MTSNSPNLIAMTKECEKVQTEGTNGRKCCYQFSALFIKGGFTFFDLPFLINKPVEAVPVILGIPCQVQFRLHLGLPHPLSLHNHTLSLCSSQVTSPCSHCEFAPFP